MKNFNKFLLLSLLTFLSFSCSQEEDQHPQSDNPLVGSWEAVSMEYTGSNEIIGLEEWAETFEQISEMSGQEFSAGLKSEFSGRAHNINYTVKFEENPNVFSATGSYQISFQSMMMGLGGSENFEFSPTGVNGTWELNGDKLITTYMGETQEMQITELTSSKFAGRLLEDLSQNSADLGDMSGFDYTINRKMDMVMEFRRK